MKQPTKTRKDEHVLLCEAMSVRDMFAASALSGMLASHSTADATPTEISLNAYQLADAMLEARKVADNSEGDCGE